MEWVFAENRTEIRVFDRESDIKKELNARYPGLLNTFRFNKRIARMQPAGAGK